MFAIAMVYVSAILEGDVSLLKLVSDAHQMNTQKIMTWTGTANIKDTLVKDGMPISEGHNKAEFVYDANRNATRWTVINADGSEKCSAMRKDLRLFRCFPGVQKVGSATKENMLVIWPATEQKVRAFADDFDPMWYFTRAGQDIIDKIEFQRAHFDDPKATGGYVKRDGDLIIWELQGKESTNHYEFDLKQAGNLIKCLDKDDQITVKMEWAYANTDGLWIPQTFDYINTRADDSGRTVITRKVEFKNNVVNSAVAEAEFALDKIGFLPGMMVTDRASDFDIINGILEPLIKK